MERHFESATGGSTRGTTEQTTRSHCEATTASDSTGSAAAVRTAANNRSAPSRTRTRTRTPLPTMSLSIDEAALFHPHDAAASTGAVALAATSNGGAERTGLAHATGGLHHHVAGGGGYGSIIQTHPPGLLARHASAPDLSPTLTTAAAAAAAASSRDFVQLDRTRSHSDPVTAPFMEGDENDPAPRYVPFFSHAPPHPTEPPWKHRAHAFLESKRMHTFVMVLVILDLLAVLTDMFVELFSYQKCREHTGEEVFEESHATHVTSEVLRIFSIVILGIFVVENLAKFVVLGPRYFIRHPLHIFDAAVIFTSFFATIFLHGALEEVVALFVLLRLWRIMRIVDGVAITLQEEHDKHGKKKDKLIIALKAELMKLKEEAGKNGTQEKAVLKPEPDVPQSSYQTDKQQ